MEYQQIVAATERQFQDEERDIEARQAEVDTARALNKEPTNATWDNVARVWRFPSGASVGMGHERFAYATGEYHAIFVDDATLFADHEYRRVFQIWRRRQGSTTPMRVRVATSPGGPGHDWVRERFAIDNPASVLPLGRRVVFASMD